MANKYTTVTIVPSCTGTTASNRIIFDLTEIKGAIPRLGGSAILKSVTVHSLDDFFVLPRLIFCKENLSSMGTPGAAVSISAAKLGENVVLGAVDLPTVTANNIGDYVNSAAGTVYPNLILSASDGSSSVYVCGVSIANTAQSYTNRGLVITLGIEWN